MISCFVRLPDAFIGKRITAFSMKIKTKLNIIALFLLITIGSLPMPVSASGDTTSPSVLSNQFILLDSFQSEQPGNLSRLEINEFISLPIIQQPRGNVTFISPIHNYVTEYQSASIFGAVGLLAHNYLAGQYFSQIIQGQKVSLIYSDNETIRFVVKEIQRYQALTPESPSSDFIDLSSGEYLTASQVFKRTYGSQPGRLILQTCISADQNPSWGRLFVIAEPIDIASDNQ
jgi:hypothetical protein